MRKFWCILFISPRIQRFCSLFYRRYSKSIDIFFHHLHAFSFRLHRRMDISVQRDIHGRMTQNLRQAFNIEPCFGGRCGERMTEGMEISVFNLTDVKNFFEMVLKISGFDEFRRTSCQNVSFSGKMTAMLLQFTDEKCREGDDSFGAAALRCRDDDLCFREI